MRIDRGNANPVQYSSFEETFDSNFEEIAEDRQQGLYLADGFIDLIIVIVTCEQRS